MFNRQMKCISAWNSLTWAIMCLFSGMWSFSVSELAIPGAEIGRISATDADLGENAKLEYTILEGETGDTFNITGVNQEAVITLNKVSGDEGNRGHYRWRERLKPVLHQYWRRCCQMEDIKLFFHSPKMIIIFGVKLSSVTHNQANE